MNLYPWLKRRLKGERYVHESEFYQKLGSLGFTRTETGRLIKQMEMTKKLTRKPKYFEIEWE